MNELLEDLKFYEKIKAKLKELEPKYYQLSGIDNYIKETQDKINTLVLETL